MGFFKRKLDKLTVTEKALFDAFNDGKAAQREINRAEKQRIYKDGIEEGKRISHVAQRLTTLIDKRFQQGIDQLKAMTDKPYTAPTEIPQEFIDAFEEE